MQTECPSQGKSVTKEQFLTPNICQTVNTHVKTQHL